MHGTPDGNAIIWCEGAFANSYGKTAHGLIRRSHRYRVMAVIDSTCAGRDAGDVLDGAPCGVPVVADLEAAMATAAAADAPATHFVIGIATDGGRLPQTGRVAVRAAIAAGLNVDSGLHDFLNDDPEFAALAATHGVTLRDVRRTPPRGELHAFTGEIEEVGALRIAVLGTDSAVGKRTTAWKIVEGLRAAGHSTEMIGTGQTAWLQGADYSIILDSMINDFLAGELEHVVVRAWRDRRPEALVIEGQGSLMNPAYPGGYEIIAATRPDVIVVQHAPSRIDYDGFPGYPVQPLPEQIDLLERISGKPVAAVTLNHEGIAREDVPAACAAITAETGLPAVDVLVQGADVLIELLASRLAAAK